MVFQRPLTLDPACLQEPSPPSSSSACCEEAGWNHLKCHLVLLAWVNTFAVGVLLEGIFSYYLNTVSLILHLGGVVALLGSIVLMRNLVNEAEAFNAVATDLERLTCLDVNAPSPHHPTSNLSEVLTLRSLLRTLRLRLAEVIPFVPESVTMTLNGAVCMTPTGLSPICSPVVGFADFEFETPPIPVGLERVKPRACLKVTIDAKEEAISECQNPSENHATQERKGGLRLRRPSSDYLSPLHLSSGTSTSAKTSSDLEGRSEEDVLSKNDTPCPSPLPSGFSLSVSKRLSGLAKMRKRRGSVLSLEFDILSLAEMCSDPYATASAIVSEAVDVVKQEDGSVMCIRADGIIATWNTLYSCTRHAWSTCRSALKLGASEEIQQLTWSIACVSGSVFSGTIGNAVQKAPFVLGQVVEEAGKMHSLAGLLGVSIVVGETLQEVANVMKLRPIDIVHFSRSSRKTRQVIYELLPDDTIADVARWKDAFHAFLSGNGTVCSRNVEDIRTDLQRHEYSDEVQHEEERLTRFVALTGHLLAQGLQGSYARTLGGWEVQQFERGVTRRPSTLLSPSSTALRVEPGFSSMSLLSAIEMSRDGAASDDSTSSDSERSFLLDEPPACFSDSLGATYRRSSKQIGKGAFGEVWLGMSEEGSLVALKYFKTPEGRRPPSSKLMSPLHKKSPLEEAVDSAVNEVRLLSQYKDDSIVEFMSCGVYDKHVIIVMEYVSGGSLAGVLDQFGSLPTNTAKRYTRDILVGLHYLHSSGIVHRDLKPANVLLHSDGQCKLSDFGASVELSSLGTDGKAEGTPLFMSPEGARGEAYTASDLWSLGHTVVQMLLGDLPFAYADSVPKGSHPFMRWLCAEEGDVPLPPRSRLGGAASFVEGVLVREPSLRKTAEELLFHPFVM